MTLRYFFLLFFVCASFVTKAQYADRYWVFGDSAGISFSNINNPVPVSSSGWARGSCASIADTLGNLVFYSKINLANPWGPLYNTEVFSNNDMLMANGDSLIGNNWYNENMIIPNPKNDSTFYLFTTNITGPSAGHFFYSFIDIKLNGGAGLVVQKNILLNSYDIVDAVAVTRHGNGRDWWILLHDWQNSNPQHTFYKYLITPDSINNPLIQNIGVGSRTNAGTLKFSKDGSRLIFTNVVDLVEVFNFDRCTGLLTNNIVANNEQFGAGREIYFGASISADNHYAYVSNAADYWGNLDSFKLYQFDLSVANIASSKTLIHQQYLRADGGMHQLGPDGKIYISFWYENWSQYPDSVHNIYNENLSVINNPDSGGLACNYAPFSFYLGGRRSYLGLPNNPNYELGRLIGSPCDTLTAVSSIKSQVSRPELKVFYHAGWHKLFVNAQNIKGKALQLSIYNIAGGLVYQNSKPSTGAGGFFASDVNCTAFAEGMYIVVFKTEKEVLKCRFVKD